MVCASFNLTISVFAWRVACDFLENITEISIAVISDSLADGVYFQS